MLWNCPNVKHLVCDERHEEEQFRKACVTLFNEVLPIWDISKVWYCNHWMLCIITHFSTCRSLTSCTILKKKKSSAIKAQFVPWFLLLAKGHTSPGCSPQPRVFLHLLFLIQQYHDDTPLLSWINQEQIVPSLHSAAAISTNNIRSNWWALKQP